VQVLNKNVSDNEKINRLMRQALEIGNRLDKDSILSIVYVNYCNFIDLPEDSIHYYINKSKEIATRYNDEYALIGNRIWQAHYLNKTRRKQKVLPLLRQSLLDAQRIGNVNLEISTLLIHAAYYRRDDPKKAFEYDNQAYELARKNGNTALEVYILTHMLSHVRRFGNKDEIIDTHIALEEAMIADRENVKKFIGDYVRYNTIQLDNKLLEDKNARRTLWLVLISSGALIIVLVIYLIMLRRTRKAKGQIEALNNAANMQIIAMEEAKHQAIREEQQRLGQDLHDGLSGSIAGIKHQLEILSMDTDDSAIRNRLGAIKTEVTKVYETARNKSHEWFSATSEQEGQSFEARIKLLTDSALPDSRYQKEIHIDNSSLLRVNSDIRISLLRIIQEAVTNIIKHAKAKSVGILIYEENDRLQLVISDDGRGLGEAKSDSRKSKMGLQSINRRVQLLNGQLVVQSSVDGTEITAIIPL